MHCTVNVYITGSITELADWDTSEALALSDANYPEWTLSVMLPPSTYVEYKYITLDSNGTLTWESDVRRR